MKSLSKPNNIYSKRINKRMAIALAIGFVGGYVTILSLAWIASIIIK